MESVHSARHETDSIPSMSTQPPHKEVKIGKGMLYIFWILVLGFLTYLMNDWLIAQINPNRKVDSYQANGQITIELERNRYNHYVTTGTINQHSVTFLLDTGATDVAVPLKLAEKLGMPKGNAYRVMTANGDATAYRSHIRSLTLGEITLTDVRASITPSMLGTDVLLGMSALKEVDFSQSGNRLTIRYNP